MRLPSRLDRVRQGLITQQIDALIVPNLQDIRYLSGFSGSAALGFIEEDASHLFLDSRYVTQGSEEVVGFAVVPAVKSLWESLLDHIKEKGKRRIGFCPSEISCEQYRKLEGGLNGVELVAGPSFVGHLRMTKDPDEVKAMRRSAALLSENLGEVLTLVRPGMRENEIAALLEYALKRNGADRPGFETIVASGPRSAMPHAQPSTKALNSGDFLKIDAGAQMQGYHSDITRTTVLGSPTPRQKEILRLVREAHDQAVSAARPGMVAREVDAAARRLIEEAGYGAHFGHGTGHGIGLAVHEEPRISKDSMTLLEEGMTFTIEPGIYLPGVGGVRIEDTVVLTRSGAEMLTTTPRELTL